MRLLLFIVNWLGRKKNVSANAFELRGQQQCSPANRSLLNKFKAANYLLQDS